MNIWDFEQQRRNEQARQHDADMIGMMQCRRCFHIGLAYATDVIGNERHVYADCPECGARREI